MASVLEIENIIKGTWGRHMVLRVCVCMCNMLFQLLQMLESQPPPPGENEREIQGKQKLKDVSFE